VILPILLLPLPFPSLSLYLPVPTCVFVYHLTLILRLKLDYLIICSWLENVSSFFLGAYPQLKNPDLVWKQDDRYRLNTVTTGTVRIKVCIFWLNFVSSALVLLPKSCLDAAIRVTPHDAHAHITHHTGCDNDTRARETGHQLRKVG
jgi:hypothetical protein